MTLGNVILHTGEDLATACFTYAHRAGECEDAPILLCDHERAHVLQAMALGPLFLPLYLLSGGISARNRFERAADRYAKTRSEERRVGKECVSTCRSRWSPDN